MIRSRRHRSGRGFAALACAVAGATGAQAADLTRHLLPVAGSVQRVLAEDLDGDGRRELLVFASAAATEPQRRVSVYGWSGTTLDTTTPRSTWLLEPDAGMLDFGRDPQDGPSLWFCTPTAVRRYRLREALARAPAAETWMEAPNVLGGNTYQWILFYDFARDWRGDGADTPAVFQPGRVLLPQRDPAAPPDVLELRSEIEIVSLPVSYDFLPRLPLLVTHRLPILERADATGDGRLDVLAALGDRVAIYPGAADGTIARRPQHSIRLPSHAETSDETQRQSIQFADVNGDGRVDAVLSTITGGITNLRQTTEVFPGGGDGFASAPSASLTAHGAAGLTVLIDLDGDGHPELTNASVTLGVGAVLRFLLTRRMRIEYATYAFDARGRLAERPLLEWTQTVGVDLDRPGDPGIVTLAGDFDGDGVRDVVSARADDAIEIRRVQRSGSVLSLGSVLAVLDAPGRGQGLARDLDGDGHSELVIYTPQRIDGGVMVFLDSQRE